LIHSKNWKAIIRKRGPKSMQMLKRYTHLRAEDLVERLDQVNGISFRIIAGLPGNSCLPKIHKITYYMCIEVTGTDAMESDNVRTNIVLDSKLVEAGLKATGLKTRRELVDFALRELLRHKQQKKLLSLKGKVAWEGDLAEMRIGRGQ
jgi:Arc/MetJ family transcription regulator